MVFLVQMYHKFLYFSRVNIKCHRVVQQVNLCCHPLKTDAL